MSTEMNNAAGVGVGVAGLCRFISLSHVAVLFCCYIIMGGGGQN